MNENNLEHAIKRKRDFSYLMWLMPVLALFIAGWLVYQQMSERAKEIVVVFDNADGFVVDKTPLKYKGIEIGVVSDIKLNPDNLKKFLVTISVNNRTFEALARKGNLFWKVEPKVSLTEVTGLSAIISGNYIEVQLVKIDKDELVLIPNQYTFEASHSKPAEIFSEEGVFVTLKSQKGNLTKETPLLYKSFVVGKVFDKTLEGTEVVYKVLIQNKYKHLLREDSRFWKISALDVKASLSGIKVKFDNVQTFVKGGIAFDSPNDSKVLAKYDKSYRLYDSFDDLDFNNHSFKLISNKAYHLEEEFSRVYYKGLDIGKIIKVNLDENNTGTIIEVKLKEKYQKLLLQNPHFEIIKPEISLTKVRGLNSLIKSNYIQLTIHGDKKTQAKESYKLYDEPKRINMYTVKVKTQGDTKVSAGSPVFYKNIKIGYVDYKRLNKAKDTLTLGLRIYWIYHKLVNDTSLFFEQSPIEFKASLKEVRFKTAPLKTFVTSGLELKTVDLKSQVQKREFKLYLSFSEVEKAAYVLQKGRHYQLRVEDTFQLKLFETIYYKGIEAGKVISNRLDKQKDEVIYDIFVLDEFTSFINQSTKFYSLGGLDVDLTLNKINVKSQSLDTVVNGGISFYTANKNMQDVNANHTFELYKSLTQAQEDFVHASITMPRGFDLQVGSKIVYKDITIGNIIELDFAHDERVVAQIQLQKQHENLLNANTLFYLDQFKFSVGEVQNPSGILFGSQIKVIAGDSTRLKKEFDLLTYKPMVEFDKEGLRVVVLADKKSSLKQNSPIYYRQVQIGVVEKYALSSDSASVRLQLFIESKYAHLVRNNSVFYNAGAFGVDFYLFGVKIQTETLETLISGGIVLATPTQFESRAVNMQEFTLHNDVEEEWLEWKPKLSVHQ